MKALMVRLSSIGDVVHTLPALHALRQAGWDPGWVVEPLSRTLLDHHPSLDRVIIAPRARLFSFRAAGSALSEIRQQGYDVALDFQGLWKSAAWARLSGAPRALGFARPWRREPLSSVLLHEHASLPPEAVHVIDKNLALLRPLGIDAIGLRAFSFARSQSDAEKVVSGLLNLGLNDFAILNPGGGWSSKLWPAERYGTVARGLGERGLRVLVTWGPGDERLAERVVAASSGAAVRCFPTTLVEYLEVARRARLVVAADTGPLHLACAVETPVVGIFGPTDPARNGPFSSADVVVRRTPLCSPCHKRRCPVHDGVMSAITVAEVLKAIDRRLGLPARAHAV